MMMMELRIWMGIDVVVVEKVVVAYGPSTTEITSLLSNIFLAKVLGLSLVEQKLSSIKMISDGIQLSIRVLHSVLDKFEIMGNATTICSTKQDLFQAQNGGHGSGCENHFCTHTMLKVNTGSKDLKLSRKSRNICFGPP
jgi:hypothetical protein